MGHISRVFRSKPWNDKNRKANALENTKTRTAETHRIEESNKEQEEYGGTLYSVKDRRRKPFVVKPSLNGTDLLMEIDTGASLSLISEETYQHTWSREATPPLLPSQAHLRTYTAEAIQTLGRIEVEVSINNQTKQLSLEVVQGSGPSLLGIDWLEKLKIDWTQVYQLRSND